MIRTSLHQPLPKIRKQGKIRTVLFLLLLISACGPEILFQHPLPKGKKDMPVIPALFYGTYKNIGDSSMLFIDSLQIISTKTDNRRMTRIQLFAEIDTTIDHDTLVWVTPGWSIEIKFFGDSAEFISQECDTLFRWKPASCIREFRQILFLNTQTSDQYWTVQIIQLTNDSLYLGDLVSTAEIDAVRELTHVVTIPDTVNNKVREYRLNPTQHELKSILKRKKIKPAWVRQ
jgi:hypothetical protein